MWQKFIEQWMAFWWVPRADQASRHDQVTDEPGEAEQAAASAPEPAPERVADDFTVIKGIGPAVQKKLRGLDILTFGDLAAADPDALIETFKGSQPISVAQVKAWTEAARERSQV